MPTLIVEDGSQATPTSANSFVTLAFSDTYHSDRGNTAWASAASAKKIVALIRAGQYLNSLAWKGQKVLQKQVMCAPRLYWYDEDGYQFGYEEIPFQLKHAQCEAALLELTADTLQPNVTRLDRVKREKTDVLETEYFSGTPSRTSFTKVNGLLRGLIKNKASLTIIRA